MHFVVVYQREPHARQMAFDDVPQPTTYAERAALARRTLTEHQLDVDLWIDDLGDRSRATFGDLPHAAVVVDREGVVRLKLSWCDPGVLATALRELAGAQPRGVTPRAASFLAAVNADRPAPTDPSDPSDLADAATHHHHRQVMLAHLVARCPDHEDRPRWLEELRRGAPPQQRAWLDRLGRTAGPRGEQGPPGPATGDAGAGGR